MNRTSHGSRKSASLILLVVLAAMPAAPAQTYRIRELPPPVANGVSYGFGINDAGVVVGQAASSPSGNGRAVQWIDGALVDLGAAAGSVSIAAGISDDGRIVGRRGGIPCTSGADPFVWDDHVMGPLPDPPRFIAELYQVNGVGNIAVGDSFDSCSSPPYNFAACRWQHEAEVWSLTLLPPLDGDPEAGAYDVSNAGTIVGFSGDWSGQPRMRACVWESGLPNLLPDLGGGYSIAYGVDNQRRISGYSQTEEGRYRAYTYDGAAAIDLGTLAGFAHSAATRLNEAGTVIGFAFNGAVTDWPYVAPDSNQRAVLWRDGVLYDVSGLIPAGSGWTSLNSLWDINERGQITGYGVRNGRYRAFLLTPNVAGDANCDGGVNFNDIDAFVLALVGGAAYDATYPDCDIRTADVDRSGSVTFDDIDPFVRCLIEGGCG